MAKTVSEAFRVFLSRLTPSQTEIDAAASHRDSINRCLNNSLKLNRLFRTGSFGNGTSVKCYSDLDYFASIGSDDVPENSASLLNKVQRILEARFPETGVCVRSPAIRLPFADGAETVEVVPASCLRKTSADEYVYDIADGGGSWLVASPEAHNNYVARVNKDLDGKVRPLIRFIKAWNFFRSGGILSFYLELRTAKYSEGETTIMYSLGVRRVIRLLVNCELAAVQDPRGISGLVSPCSVARKDDALSKLQTALGRAEKAVKAEIDQDHEAAIGWWQKFYGYRFPPYG